MNFLVPKLSATMESAKVLRWLKQAGDKVVMGEPLVELETDKATMEVESPVDGTLQAMLAEPDAELPIGGLLARLTTAADGAPAKAGTSPAWQAEIAPARPMPVAAPASGPAAAASPLRLRASPLAKRLAKMHDVDLGALAGSGPQQRVRKRDVLAAVGAHGAVPAPSPAGFEPLSAMRSQIAQAVTLSRQTIPAFVLDRWVETTAMAAARAALGPAIEQATGIKPTFTAVASGVNLTLAVDHRLIDGLAAAEFLASLADRIERGPWSPA